MIERDPIFPGALLSAESKTNRQEIAKAEFQKKVYEIQANGFSSSLTGYFLSGLKQSFSPEDLCELFLIASTEAIIDKERLAKENEGDKNKVLDFDMNGLPKISDIWRQDEKVEIINQRRSIIGRLKTLRQPNPEQKSHQ